MSTELTRHYEQEGGLGVVTAWRNPEQVLAEATQAAEALSRVIALKPKPVVFNGETYLEYEDWSTVAKFYGLTAKVLETRHVEYSGITGWEAVAVAIDKNGMEVSRAESMCMTDELNWGAVPVYEWQDEVNEHGKKIWIEAKNGKKGYFKGKRVQTGTQPKPMFQLRSMAQTRSCAKALRQVLSWVVVLGGFKPNVAEEMIESQLGPEGQQETRQPVQQPKRASEKAKPAEGQEPALETVEGPILAAKQGKEGTALWLKVGDEQKEMLVKVPPEKIWEEMAEGNYLVAKCSKGEDRNLGAFFLVVEVTECSIVQDDEEAEQVAETKPAAEAVTENPVLQGMFEEGTVKPASQVEATANAKEKAWKGYPGHDPEKHITYKQGGLLFRIQNENKLTDAQVKEALMLRIGAEHRQLIAKDKFQAALDVLDPEYKHHEKK